MMSAGAPAKPVALAYTPLRQPPSRPIIIPIDRADLGLTAEKRAKLDNWLRLARRTSLAIFSHLNIRVGRDLQGYNSPQ